jgi:DNA polymerase I-like protein with 3'-5' exonuclease and polymerase domains
LARDWLGIRDGGKYKEAFAPWTNSSKDWGSIPIEHMGPYACHDVWENRLLYRHIKANLSSDVSFVSDLENKVTECLYDTEQLGFRVDPFMVQVDTLSTVQEMAELTEKIREKHGAMMRPNVNKDCWALLHCHYGLPVIKYTNKEETDPSYDKDALATYLKYPEAPIDLLEDILRFRQLGSHYGFLKSLESHQQSGRIHSTYNQAVRTGRMSCKEPNNQQWNQWIKRHVLPDPERVYLSCDYKSIEFRIIAHYLSQPEMLRAFNEDPDTDFHQWVADMCSVTRRAAKTINFAIAFGGGKARVLKLLAADESIIEMIVADTPEGFQQACQMRANQVFNKYHRTLYNLRKITKLAASRLNSRGFVKNIQGRRRHLPPRAAFRAFNTVVQSGAADKMKEAVVETSPRFNQDFRNLGIEQVMFVHDEILFSVPKENEAEAVPLIRENMIGKPRYNVPMRVDIKHCHNNWGESKDD